jgi:MFS family permease
MGRQTSTVLLGVLGRVRMLTPLRVRDFRLLWTGMTVSLVGDGIFLVAIAWQVYTLSNAAGALAVVGIAMSAPHVAMLLLGGVISDRIDRRHAMIGADLTRAGAIGLLGVLALVGTLALWQVLALVAVYGAATAFFGPAFDAIVPELVEGELLAEANSLDQFVRPTALRLVGPALGGVLLAATGTGVAFLVDAGTFLFAAAAILRMCPRARAVGQTTTSVVREVADGLRYVRAHVWLWGTFLSATVAYLLFIGPSEVLLPYVVKNDLGGDARLLGMVFAFGGVGAVGAALVVGQLGMPRRNMTVIFATWTLATLAIAGYGLAVAPWQLMVACLAFNGLETAGTIVWATTKHRLVPAHLLGRVSSFDWFISISLLPLSYALTAPAAAAFGARSTLVGAGILGGLVTAAFLFLPGMRDVERHTALALPAPTKPELGSMAA